MHPVWLAKFDWKRKSIGIFDQLQIVRFRVIP